MTTKGSKHQRCRIGKLWPRIPNTYFAEGGVVDTSKTALSSTSHTKNVFVQLIKFGLVGGLGAVVDYGSLIVFTSIGIQADLSRALSFILGSTTAYFLNRSWTFTGRKDAREALSVAIVYGMTFVIIVAVNAIFLRALPDSEWRLTLAWIVSQGIGTTFNFVVQRLWVFRN